MANETPTRVCMIKDIEVAIRIPYAEGHVLTAGEAHNLNQTRVENIRNNMTSRLNALAKAADVPVEELSEDVINQWLEDFAAYDESYVMTIGNAGGGKTPVDPVEKEAMRLARATITAQLKERGVLIKDVDKEALAELVAETALLDEFVDQARKNVENQKKKSKIALDKLLPAAS